jgi:hypothetical protein
MSEDGWRTHIRWVVVHPTEPRVLATRRAGEPVLPETERPGQVWTGDPEDVLPTLRQISYRSLVAGLRPPIDWRSARGTAWWLRQVLAGPPA